MKEKIDTIEKMNKTKILFFEKNYTHTDIYTHICVYVYIHYIYIVM